MHHKKNHLPAFQRCVEQDGAVGGGGKGKDKDGGHGCRGQGGHGKRHDNQ